MTCKRFYLMRVAGIIYFIARLIASAIWYPRELGLSVLRFESRLPLMITQTKTTENLCRYFLNVATCRVELFPALYTNLENLSLNEWLPLNMRSPEGGVGCRYSYL